MLKQWSIHWQMTCSWKGNQERALLVNNLLILSTLVWLPQYIILIEVIMANSLFIHQSDGLFFNRGSYKNFHGVRQANADQISLNIFLMLRKTKIDNTFITGPDNSEKVIFWSFLVSKNCLLVRPRKFSFG